MALRQAPGNSRRPTCKKLTIFDTVCNVSAEHWNSAATKGCAKQILEGEQVLGAVGKW